MSDKDIIIHVSEKNTSNSDPNGACFVCIIKTDKEIVCKTQTIPNVYIPKTLI